MFTSLRSRLIASYVLIILICLILVGLVLLALLGSLRARLAFIRLADASIPTAFRVRSLWQRGLSPAEIADQLKDQAEAQGFRILILTPEGKVLADTRGDWTGRKLKMPALKVPPVPQRPYLSGKLVTPGGRTFLYVALPITPLKPGQRPLFVALTTTPGWGIQVFLRELSPGFLLAGGIAFLVSILLALLIARSIARPLQRIAAAAEEIARGNYDLELNITSPDEVRRLATSFNRMARQVKASRQAQRDFVANVSHELKTPLTSIKGFAQAILDGTARDEAAQRRAAEIIGDEADRMSRLVDALLDLARLESGQVEMAREPVDLAEVLRRCVEGFALRAEEGGVDLRLEVPALPPVLGDRDRLAQVFTNLIDNALKHTPSGGTIWVRGCGLRVRKGKAEYSTPIAHRLTLPQVADGEWVAVEVADTGEGIPPEDLPRIFERFYQVDKSRARKGSGTGLGLAIAKEIVEAHGGRIGVESVVGLGTRFTVLLPVSTRSSQAQKRLLR